MRIEIYEDGSSVCNIIDTDFLSVCTTRDDILIHKKIADTLSNLLSLVYNYSLSTCMPYVSSMDVCRHFTFSKRKF